jgi:hypothetical protein
MTGRLNIISIYNGIMKNGFVKAALMELGALAINS